MIGRRSFFGLMAGLVAGGAAATTLSAADPGACTTISCAPPAIDPDTPFLVLTDEISIEEFQERYILPFLEAADKAFEQQLLSGYYDHMFVNGDRR